MSAKRFEQTFPHAGVAFAARVKGGVNLRGEKEARPEL